MEVKKKKAIGYIRVSTEAQANDDKYGVDVQKHEIETYANEHGYEIVEWKQDEMSGAKDDRPVWSEILYGDCYNPPVQAVIVFKNDRVARDTKLYFYYLYTLEKKNIKLLSTQETFEEGSEFANIYRSLMLFVAEQERKNIALRTSKGRSMKAACGGYAGGRAPYGYKVVNGQLEINDEEVGIVKTVFEERAKGMSMQKIVIRLFEAGYRTRNGSMFVASSIKSILDNEMVYKGYYKYGKDADWVKGVHQPIL